MSHELTQTILKSLKGYLEVTVCHPNIAGELVVIGATNCAQDFGWSNMPEEMRVDRAVYCCRPRWDESSSSVFVFADEVEVVDAPAYLVVGRMLDMMYDKGLDSAVDQLENADEVISWGGEDE